MLWAWHRLARRIMSESVRESPFPDLTRCGLSDPSHPWAVKEPVLAIHQIQGNILAGFMKDFQTLIFLHIDRARDFKLWLASQVKLIATTAEVLAFNRLFKEIRTRRGKESNAVKATWINIAFSYEGLKALVGAVEVRKFKDQSFKAGLAAHSELLGDPPDEDDLEGSPKNWVVGDSQHTPPHVVLIVASDDREDMFAEIERIEESLRTYQKINGEWASSGAHVVFKEEGANLPPPLSGHEHFGFLDGVSQPGIRGRVSLNPHDVLTLRQNPKDRNQGKPGQDLLWPGEFVFGYPGQDPNKSVEEPGEIVDAGPLWARNGSFLVFRRLRQDVFALHKFVKAVAEHFGVPDPELSSGARMVASSLVGRWPSGAPIERVPDDDNHKLANDDCANNHFEYQDAVATIEKSDRESPFDCLDDQYPLPAADPEGFHLPFTGHIRKAYPRDDVSIHQDEDPTADLPCRAARMNLDESDTQTHRILRRSIPFGPVSPSSLEAPFDDEEMRGLHFLAYQTSIEEQFEFITRCWVNNKNFKEPFGHNHLVGGHDPIIGQNNTPGEDRQREFTIAFTDHIGQRRNERVKTADFTEPGRRDWVIPTGGGYFFAPSIAALQNVLSK
jgi:Dyp-type peroxidase family